ncbi:guanine deaminase [Cognatishimia sp. SS12]|uniref:guanine deaminase n=1 Tax=Cognatishimia sp. SS12 TaxID=2979465 RepID=UPI00232DC6B2|nr:guanine deaminase [Cognatishimia sp. SS12]MDC0738614.1 guanine deaminase [Cognatishimia sp. SS12]
MTSPEGTLLLGQTLAFTDDPFVVPVDAAVQHARRGAVLMQAGKIAAVGEADKMRALHPKAQVVDYGDGVIMAGFVDAHAHYPQTAMIASWGKRLIDWLNTYTFPEEMRFDDPAYASEIANRYLDLTSSHGTTTVASYCTSHPQSADAFFEAAKARGQRVVAGKTCMDQNAPAALLDTAQSAYDDSKALLQKWHGKGRLGYAITPRFSPTSTPDQLAAMGALWQENPDCLMQTHLSEQTDEIEWVKALYPSARDYLDTYEMHGLLGERGLYGHAIHLTDRERARLRETGAGLVHCPTSNTFIGSGIFDMMGLVQDGQRVGLATDTGGGSSFSMLRTMAAAYELGQLRGTPLHAAQLIWLSTVGSARVLHLDNKIGNLTAGQEADVIVLDLASTPAIAQREAEAETLWEALFPTLMMGDDRAIASVWINGAQVR